MKSITIHGLDDHLYKLVQEKAKAEGLSLNKTIKKLLEESLGMKPRTSEKYDQFKEFRGVWSDSDLVEFEEQTQELRKIHPQDWE